MRFVEKCSYTRYNNIKGEEMILDAEFIGKNIRDIRKAAKKSQEAFAEEIDSTARTISNIENGSVVPMLQTIANISEKFNCSVDSIIKKE